MNSIKKITTLSCGAIGIFMSMVAVQAAQEPGTWVNVLAPMSDEYVSTVLVDKAKPSDAWVFRENYQGCWKSTDYGVTWFKVSAKGGVSGNGITGHGAWYAAIDPNPNRDPSTNPALYVTAGYDAGGIWKSTDGGVTWFDVWKDNVYGPDGTTNIYCDVGRDIMALVPLDPTEPGHMIADLHSYHNGYAGCGIDNNNGVFETFDGGGKWIVHRSIASFVNFAPHGDMLFALDKSTWCVSHNNTILRSTDAGTNWTTATGSVGGSTGITYCNRKVGNTWYVGTDHTGMLAKTTDMGASWSTISAVGNRVEWVLASATKLYSANGYDFDPTDVFSASIGNDAVWTKMTTLPKGGHDADITFDGTNYIIIFPCHAGGIYRYVEPATASAAGPKSFSKSAADQSSVSKARLQVSASGRMNIARGNAAFDIRGKRISETLSSFDR